VAASLRIFVYSFTYDESLPILCFSFLIVRFPSDLLGKSMVTMPHLHFNNFIYLPEEPSGSLPSFSPFFQLPPDHPRLWQSYGQIFDKLRVLATHMISMKRKWNIIRVIEDTLLKYHTLKIVLKLPPTYKINPKIHNCLRIKSTHGR
jgi:hypothetical protein